MIAIGKVEVYNPEPYKYIIHYTDESIYRGMIEVNTKTKIVRIMIAAGLDTATENMRDIYQHLKNFPDSISDFYNVYTKKRNAKE